eukprot:TRINITY_DN4891_c0_g2_i1.p1 TRINITY_DN4891_c0_g2~~TRINITY_DN4891_c0_g2_i1.p1  ORF type:complete len:589 (+),score=121.18 TRINITY_DN4891_c0_g2_i1:66-1832(+)
MPSDKEEGEYHEIFALMDTDGNGVIGLTELSRFMASFGNSPPLTQIEEIFKQCDEDASGSIDADEFINVVETVKLLQNQSTAQILEGFKCVKYTELFRLADPSGTDLLPTSEVVAMLEKLPSGLPTEELTSLVVQHETPSSEIHLDSFKQITTGLTKGLKIQETLEYCRKGLREVLENREAKKFYNTLERSKSTGPTQADEHEPEIKGSPDCENCVKLKGRVKHHKLQIDAERAIIKELRNTLEEQAGKLNEAERMNKDLVFENEKLKKKIRQMESGAEREKVSMHSEQVTQQEQLKSALEQKTKDLHDSLSELESVKKNLSRQKQESARQGSALALLHKHVAQIEKDNEVLKRGGDREHVREYISKQKILTAKLEDANKTIEAMQQESWYSDKLTYLTGQKASDNNTNSNNNDLLPTRSTWQTNPRLTRTTPGSICNEYGTASRGTFSAKKRVEIATDPTEDEYRVLSNFYHKYMGVKGTKGEEEIVSACGAGLTKVGAHHPAYWTGKENGRIKSWMRHPVVPDSISSSVHKKRYVVAQSGGTGGGVPSQAASPSIPGTYLSRSPMARSVSPSRRSQVTSSTLPGRW